MAKLSNRTFGVEFEVFFYTPKWRKFLKDYKVKETDDSIADANKVLQNMGMAGWEAKEDASIKGGDVQIEFISPILQGAGGLKQAVQFVTTLRQYADVNESVGLHVHVGAQDFKQPKSAAEKLTAALLQYKNVEDLFDSLVLAHRQKNQSTFARSPKSAQSIINRYKGVAKTERTALVDLINKLQDDRYVKLNLESLIKHGTLEFRQLHGTLNPELIKNWIIICTSFVDTVAETEQMFVNMLRDLKNAPFEGAEEKLSPRGQKEVVSSIIEQIASIIYEEGVSRNATDAYFRSLIKKGQYTTNGIIQMLGGNIQTDIMQNEGKSYLVFIIPNSKFASIFRDGSVQAGVKRVLESLLGQPQNARLKNSSKSVAAPDALRMAIEEPLALQMAEDRIGQEARIQGPIKPEQQATLDKAKQAILGKLPQRNISKLGKQLSASPLRETYIDDIK